MHFYSLMLASSAMNCSMFQLFFLPCLSIMNYYIRCILRYLLALYFSVHSFSVSLCALCILCTSFLFCSVISLFLTVSFYYLLMLTMAIYICLCAIIYYLTLYLCAMYHVFKYRLPYSTVCIL